MKKGHILCIFLLGGITSCGDDNPVEEVIEESTETICQVTSLTYQGVSRGSFGLYNEQSEVHILYNLLRIDRINFRRSYGRVLFGGGCM